MVLENIEINPQIIEQFKVFTGTNSKFLSFEGIEGSGKSTQIQLLKKELEKLGKTVHILREPGGTTFGENLRSAILESKNALHPQAEAYLFASSRAQLLFEKILPILNLTDQVVILDRYIDSSIAYQGMARGLGARNILETHLKAPLNILPHKTIYLSIDLETSLERQAIRGNEKDYFEKEQTDFYQKLIDGFNLSATVFPNRIITIDGSADLGTISAKILNSLKSIWS